MILEVAILDVRPGQSEAFERDFAEARSLVAETEDFRGSPQYARWRELLHHDYDPFPTVEHYAPVEL